MTMTAVPPVVDLEWVKAQDQSRVVLCDVRWTAGKGPDKEAYLQGHAPGAFFVDTDADLAAPAGHEVGRHPLPSPEAFAATLSRLGIDEDSLVIAYDDAKSGYASRLVWMLRVLGVDAALLNGGLKAFGDELRGGNVIAAPTTFAPRPWPEGAIVDLEGMRAAVAEDTLPFAIVDARAPQRFLGEEEPIDPIAGRIPGAVNLPFNFNLGRDHRLVDDRELEVKFAEAGLSKDAPVVVYCGSGMTACADIIALWHLGFEDVKLYPGSWSEWIGHDTPKERGPADEPERF